MPSLRFLAAFGAQYAGWLLGRSKAPAVAPDKSENEHRTDVDCIKNSLRTGSGPFRLLKRGAGHQARAPIDFPGTIVDVRCFDAVLAIDEQAQNVLVEPQVTMRQLVERCGRYGFAPCVIPEFPDITVGGAIQGLGAESSSHSYGLFHESVEWMEVVLGDGTCLRLSPDDHPDLWRALPGSYGSLALLTLVCLRLRPRTPVLQVQHRMMQTCDFLAGDLPWADDFVDAIEVGFGDVIVTTARHGDVSPAEVPTYRPRWPRPYYCDHVLETGKERRSELMTFEDYVFRYDRGAFWIAPTKLGRSFFARFFFSGFATASNLYGLREIKRRFDPAPSSRLVQDCIVPVGNAADFLEIVREEMQGPLWLLPIRSQAANLFGLRPGNWMNVGIYLRHEGGPAEAEECNRRLENALNGLGGRKTLHAELFVSRDAFAEIYDIAEYERLRSAYHAARAFPHILDKLGIGDGR